MDQPILDTARTYVTRLETGEKISGGELARVLQLLAAHEVDEGGPYARCSSCRAPDLELNVSVDRFLELCGVHLPKVRAYIESQGARQIAERYSQELVVITDCSHGGAVRTADEEYMLGCIHERLSMRLVGVSEEIVQTIHTHLGATIARNHDGQMTLMPYYMREALGEMGASITDERITEHGLASACFWTSFIAYDDFWDEDEAATPASLPAANLMARQYVQHFERVLDATTGFRDFFHEMMDRLDSANAWEVAACRMSVVDGIVHVPETLPAYEDFSIKFYPAAGQCMAPVALLLEVGYSLKSPEVTALIDYFRHYLVAMQLNDDLHDWKEDLVRGHISTAVAVLLLEWKKYYPLRTEINLTEHMPELENIFWYRVVEPMCAGVLDRAARAREALASVRLPNPKPLERFIEAVESTAERALQEHARSDELLEALDGLKES